MSRPSITLRLLAVSGAVALSVSACGGSSSSDSVSDAGSKASASGVSGAPSWCGSKQIKLGLTDGFGGNSWRLVTTAAAKD